MNTGRFYFISDTFFSKHDPNKTLMKNKENINGTTTGRPCFMAFPDDKESRIFWCVPISSKVSKYKNIVSKKIQKWQSNNSKQTDCDTIRFSKVLGQERAFLIQNMFPVTDTYISNQYLDKNSNNLEVRIAHNDESDIISRARKVLKLHRNGIQLVFGDIDRIYRELDAELQQETAALAVAVSH